MTAKYYQFKESFSRNGNLSSGNFSVEKETLGGKKLPSKWIANGDGGNGLVIAQNGYASLSTAAASAWIESDNGFSDALGDPDGLKKYGKNIMNALYNASTHYDITASAGNGLVSATGGVGSIYISLGKYFSKQALYDGLLSTEENSNFFDFFAGWFVTNSFIGVAFVTNGKIGPSNSFYPWWWLWFNPDDPNSRLEVNIGGPDRIICFITTTLQGAVKNTKDKNDNKYTYYGTGIIRFYEDVSTIFKCSVDFISNPRSLKFIDAVSANKKPIKSLARTAQYQGTGDVTSSDGFNVGNIDKIENITISNNLTNKYSKTISIPHGRTSLSTNAFQGLFINSLNNISPKVYDLNFWQGPSSGWSVGRI